MPRIVIDKLALGRGDRPGLAGVSATLEPGSFHVVLGPTGAGKTTLLRMIAGLEHPSSGSVRIEDPEVTDVAASDQAVAQATALSPAASVRTATKGPAPPPAAAAGRRVAMVYQQFVNYPSMTVYDNIASPLRARRETEADEVDRRVREAAERLELTPLLDRMPAELSGGQQQRTALARALVKRAGVVLLDEPLANLDFKLREQLREQLRTVFADESTVVVYASTDPVDALVLGGLTAVLDGGRLIQHAPAAEVYRAPCHSRVAQICSDPPLNLWPAQVEESNGTLRVRLGPDLAFDRPAHLESVGVGPCRIGLRPHHLAVLPHGPGAVRVPTSVELAEVTGSETLIHARHGGLALLAHSDGVQPFELGAALDLFMTPSRLFAFDAGGALLAAPDARPSEH